LAIVAAAADAMQLPPQAARPAVLAAFACARDAGLSPEAVVAALTPPVPPAKAAKAMRGGKS
jgi:hypothetical protein